MGVLGQQYVHRLLLHAIPNSLHLVHVVRCKWNNAQQRGDYGRQKSLSPFDRRKLYGQTLRYYSPMNHLQELAESQLRQQSQEYMQLVHLWISAWN